MSTSTCKETTYGNSRAGRFSFLDLARHMGATYRQRQILKNLDDAALKDIGVCRQAAIDEAKRTVWDVPNNWLK